MKIIRSFCSKLTTFAATKNVSLQEDDFVAITDEGTLVYPLVHPVLAQRFFGFDVCHQGEVKVAIKRVNAEYAYFNGEAWLSSIEPLFLDIAQIRQGMPKWQGGVQFILKLSPNARVREISFGYEVNFEITEYLLNYAIPDFLKMPCSISYTSRSDDTGKVPAPPGYYPHQIISIKIQPLDKEAVLAEIVNSQVVAPGIASNQVVQVIYSIIPSTQFVRGLYQIEKLPCILIRELPIRRILAPFRMDILENELDYPIGVFDLPLEILVMGQNMAEAKTIMRSLMEYVRDKGRIHIPPIDMDIGVYLMGMGEIDQGEIDSLEFEGGMGVDEAKGIIGGVTTAKFKMALKNLDY